MRFQNNKRKKFHYTLQLTPIVDIMFLLLIFFMLESISVQVGNQVDINLPDLEIGSLKVAGKNQLIININENQEIFINDKKLDLKEFNKLLFDIRNNIKIIDLIIRADKNIKYNYLLNIFEICKQNNFTKISIQSI